MNRSQLVFGLLFVAVGVLLLADRAGQVNTWAVVADWWPTVVIASGVAQLVTRPRNVVGALVLLVFGGALLAWTLGAIDTIALLWPVLLIGLGLWLLTGRTTSDQPSASGRIDLSAAVDNRSIALPAGTFRGGSATAGFGNLELDLRATNLPEGGATLHTTTIFGDVRLDIPDSWQLRVSGPELLGDIRLERPVEQVPDGPVLHLRVLTIFGDIVVRNRRDSWPPRQTAEAPRRLADTT
jgi:hypothetical protein